MAVTLDGGTVVLSAACGVAEVETLVNYLADQPDCPVDLSRATSIHTALWQALIVLAPKIQASPDPTTSAGAIFRFIISPDSVKRDA